MNVLIVVQRINLAGKHDVHTTPKIMRLSLHAILAPHKGSSSKYSRLDTGTQLYANKTWLEAHTCRQAWHKLCHTRIELHYRLLHHVIANFRSLLL